MALKLSQSLVRDLKTHQNLTSYTKMQQKDQVSERWKIQFSLSNKES